MIRFFTLMAMVAVMAVGSWWATLAIRDGQPGWFLFRFALVVAFGTYYLLLFRIQEPRRMERSTAPLT